MNLAKALDILERIETETASLYRHFSEVLSDDPEVSRLFADLADDEDSHRASIRYQQRIVRMNAKGFNEIQLDGEALSGLLQGIERTRATPAITPVAALKFAKEIELSAGEHHLKNALGSTNPEIAGLLRSLGNGDEDHLARLTALLHKRSGT
jgi:rubrerythrin